MHAETAASRPAIDHPLDVVCPDCSRRPEGSSQPGTPAAEQLTGIDLEQATGGRSMRLSPASSRRRLQTLSVQAENDDQTMMVGRGWSGNWGRKSGVSTRPGSRYCRAPVVLRRARGSSSLINDLTKVVRL
ncbi:MAG: hypothetical protein R2849_13775 [Thermomicrobiales bacterium]